MHGGSILVAYDCHDYFEELVCFFPPFNTNKIGWENVATSSVVSREQPVRLKIAVVTRQ